MITSSAETDEIHFLFGVNNGEDTISDLDISTEVIQILAGLDFTSGSEVLATGSRTFIKLLYSPLAQEIRFGSFMKMYSI